MSNQIAVRAHTQPGDELICDVGCHILNHEAGGAAVLSGVTTRPVEGDHGVLDVTQLFGREPAGLMLGSRLQQFRRSQQAAHMIGAEWGHHGIARQNGMSSSRSLTGVRPRTGAAGPEARGSSPKPPPA